MDKTEAKEAKPKRRRRRKEARPGEIVDAAMAEFAEKGFGATRLEDIASRAGVVKGTIYLYFDSKETLFKAVIRQKLLPTMDHVEGQIDAYPGPTADLLRLLITLAYDKIVRSDLHVIMRILIGEGWRFPEIVRFYHDEVVTKGERLMGRIIARGIERGEFKDGPIREAHKALMGPVIAAATWRMTFDGYKPLDLDAHIAAHLDMLFNGILARDATGAPIVAAATR